MRFFEVVDHRRSVHAHAKPAIARDKLERIVGPVRPAPSAGDLHAYQIAIVEKRKTKAALSEAALAKDFIAKAPVALAFCANPVLNENKYG